MTRRSAASARRSMIAEMAQRLPRAAAVVVGEPSMMKAVSGHKGGFGFATHVRGFEVHSSILHTGVSAIMEAAKLIDWANRRNAESMATAPGPLAAMFDPPWTTAHVGMISGGTANNITAKDCHFSMDFRLVPGDDPEAWKTAYRAMVAEVEAGMKAIRPDAGITLTERFVVPALKPEADGPLGTAGAADHRRQRQPCRQLRHRGRPVSDRAAIRRWSAGRATSPRRISPTSSSRSRSSKPARTSCAVSSPISPPDVTGFPFTATGPAAFCPALPAAADVVVIGGGVMGIMTAWFLRAKGLSVVVCEKGRVAAEQSSRNWGWVRQQGRDPAELPIMIEASRIWDHLSAEVGEDLGFRRTGVLYVANTAREMAGFERWLAIAQAHGLDTRLLDRAATLAMMPGASGDWPGGIVGGLWTASDGRAEPWVAVPALARALVERGGVVAEDCAVRALDLAAGRVAGVVTERGRIACDAVVLAGGAWSSLMLRNHGVELPQLSVIASVAATRPLPEHFAGGAADGAFAFRRRLDGGYTLAPGAFHEVCIGPDAVRRLFKFWPQLKKDPFGSRYLPAAPRGFPDAWGTPRRWAADAPSPFEAMRVLNPRPNLRALARVQDAFARAFPALGRPALASAWAGMIDTMPDVVPVVDHVPALPGLVVATGLSGHGFGIGPGMGRVVADLVAGAAVGHEVSRFRFTRFSDGSKIEIGPSL